MVEKLWLPAHSNVTRGTVASHTSKSFLLATLNLLTNRRLHTEIAISCCHLTFVESTSLQKKKENWALGKVLEQISEVG